ncbi:unnamed protein product, partial [Ectocarpus sp. 8 AP-2014]
MRRSASCAPRAYMQRRGSRGQGSICRRLNFGKKNTAPQLDLAVALTCFLLPLLIMNAFDHGQCQAMSDPSNHNGFHEFDQSMRCRNRPANTLSRTKKSIDPYAYGSEFDLPQYDPPYEPKASPGHRRTYSAPPAPCRACVYSTAHHQHAYAVDGVGTRDEILTAFVTLCVLCPRCCRRC